MSSLTEKLHASGFILSEGEGNISRENAILLSGQNLGAGAVLGKKATAGTAAGAADAGNTGTSTIGTVSAGGGAKPGVYTIVMVGAGATAPFEVQDPDGLQIGDGKIGTAFSGDVVFTITNVGGTTVAGDRYTVTVSQLTTKYLVLTPAATDGSQRAAGVLVDAVDATSSDLPCLVLARLAEVNANELVWPGGITAAQKDIAIAQLTKLGIVSR
jgi:hypothetical protein